MSLQVIDEAANAVQKTPNRITLEHLNSLVVSTEFWNPSHSLHTTVCCVQLVNGYALIGHSAPVDPNNFDHELGKKLAYENALGKAWPLEGYLLRQEMHNARCQKDALQELADISIEHGEYIPSSANT